MKNRELEVILLKEMHKVNPIFQIKPIVDFKHGDEKQLPRIVSKTLSNGIVEKYEEREEEKKKGIYKQIEVHRHTISFTFTLSKNESEEDIERIREHFSHIIGSDWWIARGNFDIVIEEVTDLQDISEYSKDGYVERYAFDIVVRTTEENVVKIEHIKEVDIQLEVKVKGGITWQSK